MKVYASRHSHNSANFHAGDRLIENRLFQQVSEAPTLPGGEDQKKRFDVVDLYRGRADHGSAGKADAVAINEMLSERSKAGKVLAHRSELTD